VTASALASSIPDPSTFRSGRHFAAWLGLVPKQNSSGGKTRLGRISKQGNKYLRQLLILGATSVLRYLRREGSNPSPWIAGLLRRRPPKVVAVALANKMARIAWSVMTRGGEYEDKPVLQAV
jgi:transposase